MDTIVIVCGAGASSTFLASRMRSVARERGMELRVAAVGTEQLADALETARAVLVGPHLSDGFEPIAAAAAAHGVPVALLPETAFGPAGAAQAVDLAASLTTLGPAA